MTLRLCAGLCLGLCWGLCLGLFMFSLGGNHGTRARLPASPWALEGPAGWAGAGAAAAWLGSLAAFRSPVFAADASGGKPRHSSASE